MVSWDPSVLSKASKQVQAEAKIRSFRDTFKEAVHHFLLGGRHFASCLSFEDREHVRLLIK